MKALKYFACLFILIVTSGTAYYLHLQFKQCRFERDLLMISTVSEVENQLGKPSYIFEQEGGWFGSTLILKEEFDEGFTIRVYRVRKIPPRFLIIKVSPDGKSIKGANIETS